MLADEVFPQTAVEVSKAIERYCPEKIGRVRKRKKVIVFEGWSKLASELLIIPALAVALAVIVVGAPAIPQGLIDVVTPLITVTIWVAIWNPVDSLLFDRWNANATSRSTNISRPRTSRSGPTGRGLCIRGLLGQRARMWLC